MTHNVDCITANADGHGEGPPPQPVVRQSYRCPGERHPVSRAVHLARLSAYYAACRQCPHRFDTGHMPRQIVERIARTAERAPERSLLTSDGVRGVYRNTITRRHAAAYAAAFAQMLWSDVVREARSPEEGGARPPVRRGPCVVVGCDARPASPDLSAGVVETLRRSGCEVIDIGQVSGPCLCFAVDHLQAAGGIFVNGAGQGPAWNGLDFLGRGAQPWSSPGRLNELEQCRRAGIVRPTRSSAGYRVFAAEVPYAASLWKHFHALRPLRIALACDVRHVKRLLQEMSERLPCVLTPVTLPAAEDLTRVAEQTESRMADVIRDQQQHLGIWIDEDGQTCRVYDERGMRVETRHLLRGMAASLFEQTGRPTIVLGPELHAEIAVSRPAATLRRADDTREAISRAMRSTGAALGCDDRGRFWFREAFPACDALLSVARVLQLLSLSDRPASSLRDR